MRVKAWILAILMVAATVLTACSKQEEPEEVSSEVSIVSDLEQVLAETYIDGVEMATGVVENEMHIIQEAMEAAIPDVLKPQASSVLLKKNEKARIDYSNTKDGYVMVLYDAETSKRLKVQVKGPGGTTYTYNLYQGTWAVYPLTDGNGTYNIRIYQNVSGDQYALVMGLECDVELEDEFAPFLRPNQYVNFTKDSAVVAKAWELTKSIKEPLAKVEAVYDYVIRNMTYDDHRAATVKSGYIPDLDAVLVEKKGICFDYAALMTSMLRSQGIPCKMVFGYAGSLYHAWISVWTEETGWVDGAIFFDGTTWQRLDPTFASSANGDQGIIDYINNSKNYKDKYLY